MDKGFTRECGELHSIIHGNYGSYLRSHTVQEYFVENVPAGIEADKTMEWIYDVNIISPYLSRKVAEHGWKIPDTSKIRNGLSKSIARKAFKNTVHSGILEKRIKSGFNAPFDIWSRQNLRELILDIFSSMSFRRRGIYNLKVFDDILENHFSKKANNMMLVWQALNLELWMRKRIDSN